MGSCFTVKDNAILLAVKAGPGASKSEIKGIEGGRLKIRVAAVPEDNKANDELRAFLAKTLGLAKKDVCIIAGEKARLKTLRLPLGVKETLERL